MEFLIIGLGLLPLAIWGFVATYLAKKEEKKEERQKAAMGTQSA